LAGLWLLPDGIQAHEPESNQSTTKNGKPSSQVRLENLTWTQVRDKLQSGTTTIIIPTGGTEQNGRHMVLGKHNFIVAKTATMIAQRLGKTLVAPVIAYVPEGDPAIKSGHMAYPGTISLTPDVFEQVLEQAARSFKTHGFKTIAFLGDSGGNQASQKRVAARLSDEWRNDGVRVIHVSDYYAKNGGEELLRANGGTLKTIGTHAGIRDTSELMAVFPQGVDLKRAEPDKDGASGDARFASVALGKRLLSGKVEAAVAQIKNQMHAIGPSTKYRSGRIVSDAPGSEGFVSWLLSAIFG